MEFALFLLVNVALFLRPQDLIAVLAPVPLYNILIALNLLIAAPLIVQYVRRGLHRAPATVCVFGILAAIILSLAAQADLGGAVYWGGEFLKVAAYFLLMVAVLTTVRRFTVYLVTIVVLTVVLAALAVGHFHGVVDVPSISHAHEMSYHGGEAYDFFRLAAFGVFADPNDLSMIVVLSMIICLGGLCYRQLRLWRFALALPLVFLGYALALTGSRGGLIALLAGVGAFLMSRFGIWRTALAMAVVVPLLLGVFGGRQADITANIAGGTGGQRSELWYAGLQMIKWSPLTGIGHARFAQQEGLVAHNSFVQALAEWGLIGGTAFIGLFYIVLFSVWRLRRVRRQIRPLVLQNFQPYIMGALVAYATSMLTLTRYDVIPTYLVAGVGVSFEQLARRSTTLPALELNPALLIRLILMTLGFIAALYIYIRFVYRLF
jgi:putative inorganic carbon (hco3(-)) transporter